MEQEKGKKNMPNEKRVAVAMSGGVDSAATAALLKDQGYQVIGLTMRLWQQAPHLAANTRACCASEEVYDARRVAQTLDIPFYVVDLESEFTQQVVEKTLAAYDAGRTPNPCVLCNQYLKFDHLLKKSAELGATFLATGHYAVRLLDDAGHPQLWRGADQEKDQSYFLFATTTQQLGRIRFPLGGYDKSQTRALAQRFGLHLAKKQESQDLCFVPRQGFAALREHHQGHRPPQPGPIVDMDGKEIGQHRGIGLYTIGQRRGLGISGPCLLYVVAIHAGENRLVVGPEAALFQQTMEVAELNWLEKQPLAHAKTLQTQIRYRAEPCPATVEPLSKHRVRVHFEQPQRAITPGQVCVFYDGNRVMGGGWIQ